MFDLDSTTEIRSAQAGVTQALAVLLAGIGRGMKKKQRGMEEEANCQIPYFR